jgi:hypothetical protein
LTAATTARACASYTFRNNLTSNSGTVDFTPLDPSVMNAADDFLPGRNGARQSAVFLRFGKSGGAPCTTGCTIAISAISRRVLYYQVIYRSANNTVLAAGPPTAVAVP